MRFVYVANRDKCGIALKPKDPQAMKMLRELINSPENPWIKKAG
jgi:hypothetical protein